MCLTFYPQIIRLQALAFITPPPMPAQAAYGPRRPGQSWSNAARAAKWAREVAASGHENAVDKAMRFAYQVFADTAEESISLATDTPLPFYGSRGRIGGVSNQFQLGHSKNKGRPSGMVCRSC